MFARGTSGERVRSLLAFGVALVASAMCGCSRNGAAEPFDRSASQQSPSTDQAASTETGTVSDDPASAVEPVAGYQSAGSAEIRRVAGARRNRLAGEISPYLLEHADNPVDWFPWGVAAFEKARRENRPIFLSIGYSTCRWCHVMERLVFSNAEIAEFLNRHFVCIKVDREERPDVDDVYMTALHVYFQMAGMPAAGGWPLSMFLTPQGEPILGGTYFPPHDQPGQPGFLTIARRVAQAWREREADLRRDAAAITAQLRRLARPRLTLRSVPLDAELVRAGFRELGDTFDPRFGGIGFDPQYPDAPKFPLPVKLRAVLLHAERTQDAALLARVRRTLTRIALGGIRDHLGGGFHRYSTDRQWHVPHFEKMLYDNALLLEVYAQAYRITAEPLFARVAAETAGWLLREMRDQQGGFYTAVDAETDGAEGAYYVWQPEEIERLLPEQDARLFLRAYGLLEPQRFEHGYVLHLTDTPERLAADAGLQPAEWQSRIDRARRVLLDARRRRPRPKTDDKILADWNGLAIAALARAGRILDREEWVDAAGHAARFVLQRMTEEQGRLWHVYRAGKARVPGFLDDYANIVDGLLALHRITGDSRWLRAARILTSVQIDTFADPDGGFRLIPVRADSGRPPGGNAPRQSGGPDARDPEPFVRIVDGTPVLTVSKPVYDSVVPAGNGTATRNLIALAALTAEPRYRAMAEATLRHFAFQLSETPTGVPNLLLALEEFLAASPAETAETGQPSHPSRGRGAEAPRNESADERITSDAPLADAPAEANTGAGRALERFVPAAIAPDVDSESDAGVSAEDQAAPAEAPIVTAELYLPADALPAGRLCPFVVHLNVASGWHINANPARPEFLKPTRLTVASELGTQLQSVQYPAGRPLRLEGIDQPVQVYSGHVIIRGMLRVPPRRGDTETVTITVHYQACNDARCLRPSRLELRARLPVKNVEQLRLINRPLFPTPGADD